MVLAMPRLRISGRTHASPPIAPRPEDAVIAVAASGTTPFTRAAALAASEKGALVIAIANNADAPLFQQADVPILLDTGAEIISGSTRMNAGTAQKSALNLLSSLLMIRLGHVYDGLMVNLNVSNEKLRHRAHAILIRESTRQDVRVVAVEAGGLFVPADQLGGEPRGVERAHGLVFAVHPRQSHHGDARHRTTDHPSVSSPTSNAS